MKQTVKRVVCAVLAAAMVLSLAACAETEESGKETYTIGLCNYVDDASLNQIVENIQKELAVLGENNGVEFKIDYQNCNADGALLRQIISNFKANGVDLMIGVATPVAIAMQVDTEDTEIPVVFAAVSDPVSVGLVDSLEAPGANVTGTSDYLDTDAILSLILAQEPAAKKIGLLYDVGQDSSTTSIQNAKTYLDAHGVAYVEATGSTTAEVLLAAQSLVADGVDAVFTPTDNTIMAAELSIYESFAEAKIPHYAGADSFALNGAFLGYGVDYANLGVKTADMAAEILLEKKSPASVPVQMFDNGTATVNTETCAALGWDYDTVAATFAPLCMQVVPITTAENFE